jgi:hypothetical protein
MVIVYEQNDRGQIDVKYLEGELEPEQAADAMEVLLYNLQACSLIQSQYLL